MGGLLWLGMLIWGLAIGWIAQMVLGRSRKPGQYDWAQALIAGVVGSFVGGILGSILRGEGFQLAIGGVIGSVIGAVIVLALWYAIVGRKKA